MMKTKKITKILNNIRPPKLRDMKQFITTEKGLGLDTYETQGNL